MLAAIYSIMRIKIVKGWDIFGHISSLGLCFSEIYQWFMKSNSKWHEMVALRDEYVEKGDELNNLSVNLSAVVK